MSTDTGQSTGQHADPVSSLADRVTSLVAAYEEEPHSDECGMGACVRCVVDEFAALIGSTQPAATAIVPTAAPGPMRRGRTERETCDLNGWGIGTRLVGDEGYGPTVIRLTYFTEKGGLIAVAESRNDQPSNESESFWTLRNREWRVFGSDTDATSA